MTVVTIYTLYVLISIYTSVMQIGFINQAKRKEAVLLSGANYLKAANYAVAKEKMSIVSSFIDYLMFIAWIGFGISYLSQNIFFESDAIMNIAIVMSFVVINSVLSLPFSYYEKFVLDEKFGFNKSTMAQWIKDTLISSSWFFSCLGHLCNYHNLYSLVAMEFCFYLWCCYSYKYAIPGFSCNVF